MVARSDVKIALENWNNWRSVFEYTGSATNNPLLLDVNRFDEFLKEYSVRRTIRRGTSDRLRNRLRDSRFPLKELLEDPTGESLDAQERILRRKFGTNEGERGILSALSKIAAFLAPHTFTAWDKYARIGLNRVLMRSKFHGFRNYVEYLADVNCLLSGDLGDQIRAACADAYPTSYAKQKDRFHRRVLDVYLMRKGGRSFRRSKPRKQKKARAT